MSKEADVANITRIDHIAVLVEDIDSATLFWQEALGIQISKRAQVAAEGAEVAFLPVGGSEIELVQPVGGDSGLRRFLEKRGAGMHHICLAVDDLDGMLAQLQSRGVELINPEPRIGEGGKRYAFVHPKSAGGVLVELYEGKSTE